MRTKAKILSVFKYESRLSAEGVRRLMLKIHEYDMNLGYLNTVLSNLAKMGKLVRWRHGIYVLPSSVEARRMAQIKAQHPDIFA